jgi:hypothetical protein
LVEATFVNWPGRDGYISLNEANYWWRSGGGNPLIADLGKIDLSGIRAAAAGKMP